MRKLWGICVGVMLVMMVSVGCGGDKPSDESKAVKDQGVTKVEVSENKIRVETAEGRQTATVQSQGDSVSGTITDEQGETLNYQAGKDIGVTAEKIGVPFYPGAEIEGGAQVDNIEDADMIAVGLLTPDSLDDVKAFYDKKITGANVMDMRGYGDDASILYTWQDGDKVFTVTLVREKDGDVTNIGIVRMFSQ